MVVELGLLSQARNSLLLWNLNVRHLFTKAHNLDIS
jgi:hypothetical protein